jgi:hypothetical protein
MTARIRSEKQERFIAQRPCDGAEILNSRTPFGMTNAFSRAGAKTART